MTFDEFWARLEACPDMTLCDSEKARYRELFRGVWNISAAARSADIATVLLRRSVELRAKGRHDRASVLEDLALELRPPVKP